MFDYIYIFIFIYIHYQIYQIQDVAPQLQVSFFQPHFQIHSLVRYISTINHRFFQPRFLFGNGERVLRRGTLVNAADVGESQNSTQGFQWDSQLHGRPFEY